MVRSYKGKVRTMYSNRVWDLVEAPKEIKPIGASGSIRGKE